MRRLRVVAPAVISVLLYTHGPCVHFAGAQAADPRAAITVSTAWLAQHLNDPDLVLLHVGDPKAYPAKHIPGARFVSMSDVSVSDHDMQKDTGLMLELPPADSLRARLQALGISDRSRVVVYQADEWISPSTRIVFTLDAAGLGDRTVWLDGGLSAWAAEGRPTTAAVPARVAGTLSPLKTKPLVVDAAWVRSHLGAPGVRVVDGRAAVFYDGVEAGGPRKGHIPGAGSVPFTEVTDATLHLRSPAELAALFAKAGVGPKDTVVAYCHIGQQGTAVLFAARSLGHPVKLYDGSFQEWARRTDLPVENPAEKKE
jgi:thiosulfate/3-mercaptopyruvate sulfurtransferase